MSMLLAASREALALGASRETLCGLPTGEPETHILLLGVEPPDFQPLTGKGLEYDISGTAASATNCGEQW